MGKIKKYNKHSNGFTLIEIMVAIGIFAVLGTAFTGFLVSALQVQRESLVSQEIINNMSYNLEYMSRSIRMARKDLEGNCLKEAKHNYELTSEMPGIKFLNYQNECQSFFLDNGRIKEEKSNEINYLTPAKFIVTNFIIEGDSWDQADPLAQPKVTIFLEIEGIKFQTAISQRNLNVKN